MTCVGVGGFFDFDDDNQYGLIYTLDSGEWQMQTIAEPSNYFPGSFLSLNGVSCPDDGDCVAVGDYQYAGNGQAYDGLVVTLESGVWSEAQAPPPPEGGIEELNAVDCPEVGSCIAGGLANSGSLLLQLASGSWTASIGPVPSDAPGVGEIEGMNCPAVGACIATGIDFPGGNEAGMILTESNGTWTAEDAPLPGPTESPKSDPVGPDAEAGTGGDSETASSLAGVSCAIDGFCAAAGAGSATGGFVETASLSSIPSVTEVAPNSAPGAGGILVTITGANFTPGSIASFGGVAAQTIFVNSSELEATAPQIPYAEQVDVTVTSGNLDSRANSADVFAYTGPPPAPESLGATSGDEQVELSWLPPWDGGSAITNYVVDEYASSSPTGAETVFDTGSGDANYTATGLSNGQKYTFTVQAETSLGTGAASTPVSTIAGIPAAPTGVAAAVTGNEKIGLSWTAANGNGNAVTHYIVNEYLGSSPIGSPIIIDTGSATTTYTVTGLKAGKGYAFTVQAANALGTGPVSAAASATAATMPGAPRDLRAKASSGRVKLAWNAPANDGGSPISGYDIFRATRSGGFARKPTFAVSGATSTYTDIAVANGKTYYYVVEAVNSIGPSASSKQVVATP